MEYFSETVTLRPGKRLKLMANVTGCMVGEQATKLEVGVGQAAMFVTGVALVLGVAWLDAELHEEPLPEATTVTAITTGACSAENPMQARGTLATRDQQDRNAQCALHDFIAEAVVCSANSPNHDIQGNRTDFS